MNASGVNLNYNSFFSFSRLRYRDIKNGHKLFHQTVPFEQPLPETRLTFPSSLPTTTFFFLHSFSSRWMLETRNKPVIESVTRETPGVQFSQYTGLTKGFSFGGIHLWEDERSLCDFIAGTSTNAYRKRASFRTKTEEEEKRNFRLDFKRVEISPPRRINHRRNKAVRTCRYSSSVLLLPFHRGRILLISIHGKGGLL